MKGNFIASQIILSIWAVLSCNHAVGQALTSAVDETPLPAMHSLHDYQVASKFAQGMMLAAGAKTSVIEYRDSHDGKWPASNKEAEFVPLLDAKDPVQSVSIGSAGVITVLFNCLVAEFCSKSAVLSPAIGGNGRVEFACTALEIPRMYRRKACP